VPDSRTHRGAAPKDRELFGEEALPALRDAVAELSWLLGRGYSDVSALELVGNRHALAKRQRVAVSRCACTDAQRDARRSRRVESIEGRAVEVDGFNAIIVGESSLSGGIVLVGRDGARRDLASVHGTWRRVEETSRAIEALGEVLAPAREVVWRLDRPVGNSGRLRALLAEIAEARGWTWTIEVEPSPDRSLVAAPDVVATADAWILDRCRAWIDLPARIAGAWLVDLS
jgi:hypothetical protein